MLYKKRRFTPLVSDHVNVESAPDTSGQLNLHRPGEGTFWKAKQEGKEFVPVWTMPINRCGRVAGFDFMWRTDRAIAIDYNPTGKLDHVLCFRTGRSRDGERSNAGFHSMDGRRVVISSVLNVRRSFEVHVHQAQGSI